jgi:hypothetical protein
VVLVCRVASVSRGVTLTDTHRVTGFAFGARIYLAACAACPPHFEAFLAFQECKLLRLPPATPSTASALPGASMGRVVVMAPSVSLMWRACAPAVTLLRPAKQADALHIVSLRILRLCLGLSMPFDQG